MTPVLRSAVIGTGFIGPQHVDAIRRGGLADVVVVASNDGPQAEAVARALGIEHHTTDVASVLNDPSIDVVHICTPNATHADLARAALRAGKHVVLEKPIALTADDANELVAVARETGRHAAVSFTYRGYPMVRHARRMVANGDLGEVRLVHGAYLQDWLLEATDYNWRIDPVTGGRSRAVADIGSHWFDMLEFVTGRRVQAVFADLATFVRERQRPTMEVEAFGTAHGPTELVRVESEDAATILLRLEGGARATCLVSQVSPGRKNSFGFEIAGATRSLEWQQESPERLWLGSRHGGSQVLARELPETPHASGVPALPAGHPEGWGEALRDLLRPFYAAIAADVVPPAYGEPSPYPTFADGARAAEFVEAALRSAAEGRWADVGIRERTSGGARP